MTTASALVAILVLAAICGAGGFLWRRTLTALAAPFAYGALVAMLVVAVAYLPAYSQGTGCPAGRATQDSAR